MLPRSSWCIITILVAMVTVWLPVATQDLPPSNQDNLDPNAAHVCSSTTHESYTTLESYTQYYTKKTNTWCANIPPRCTEYLIASRTAYRIVTKTKQRKNYFCCDGYKAKDGLKYCIPSCVDDCNAHGTCILPNTCLCDHGFKGYACESNCDDTHWGPNCTHTCDCRGRGTCDPEFGHCICDMGYTGGDCSQPCLDSFGSQCVHCTCDNNDTCSRNDGQCTCKAGYHAEYTVRCRKNCDPITGDCDCPPGYTGDYCTDKCNDYTYGLNCKGQCSCENGVCNYITGECTCNFGFGGDRCQIYCPEDYYGFSCDKRCPCQNEGKCYQNDDMQLKCNCTGTGHHGENCSIRDCDYNKKLNSTTDLCVPCDCVWTNTHSCNVLTGSCECEPGYKGDQCTDECLMPYYGEKCAEICSCANGICHHATGDCESCYAGYVGPNCDQPCPSGKWGLECSNDCRCMNKGECRPSSGYCNCTAGFQGSFCEQTCPLDKFGRNCEENCTCDSDKSICSPYDGHCQCKSGYHGDQCQEPCGMWKFGHLCRHDCTCDSQGAESCNHQTGECICKPGYSGVTCSSPCKADTWGQYCKQPCDCGGRGSCNHFTGECICEPGYTGTKCENECPVDFYGYMCALECPTCDPGFICNHRTGVCMLETCQAGFTGPNCNSLCPQGRWGMHCAKTCAPTCVQHGLCNSVNGYCQCFPGFQGNECESVCPHGKFGYGCVSDCPCIMANTEACEPISGLCLCRTGYKGRFCDVDDLDVSVIGKQTGVTDGAASTSTPIIVACAVLGVIMLAFIVLLVVYFTRKLRRLKEDNLNVLYEHNRNGTISSGGTLDNSDTAGVVNPTYTEENLRNENRYPHLSQRGHTRPPLPQRQRTCEEFDDIAEEKLRVSMPCEAANGGVGSGATPQRRSSGNYTEADEDRYTTLRAVSYIDPPNSDGAAFSITEKLDSQGHRRSGSRSSREDGGYTTSPLGQKTQPIVQHNTKGVSQPLYDETVTKNSNGKASPDTSSISSMDSHTSFHSSLSDTVRDSTDVKLLIGTSTKGTHNDNTSVTNGNAINRSDNPTTSGSGTAASANSLSFENPIASMKIREENQGARGGKFENLYDNPTVDTDLSTEGHQQGHKSIFGQGHLNSNTHSHSSQRPASNHYDVPSVGNPASDSNQSDPNQLPSNQPNLPSNGVTSYYDVPDNGQNSADPQISATNPPPPTKVQGHSNVLYDVPHDTGNGDAVTLTSHSDKSIEGTGQGFENPYDIPNNVNPPSVHNPVYQNGYAAPISSNGYATPILENGQAAPIVNNGYITPLNEINSASGEGNYDHPTRLNVTSEA